MGFSDIQTRKLAAPVRRSAIKDRQVEGKTLHYLEGWHVVAEANRIFGFDGWDRETISTQCVWQKQVDYRFTAAYLTRVRISVRAGSTIIVREGLGSGEASAPSSGQAHERASKAAETDATKRALSTFGNPFGLSLYSGKARTVRREPQRAKRAEPVRSGEVAPFPRVVAASPVKIDGLQAPDAASAESFRPARVEKSELALPEPKRQRDRDHLRFVASQTCLICGRQPSQAHHLRFAQPRAMARKVSDEFTVPLCPAHHQELHMRGNETAWWAEKRIDPLPVAHELWLASKSEAVQAAE